MTEVNLEQLEAENTKLVTEFCKKWEERDVSALLPYLADDIHYEMWDADDAIVVNGKEEMSQMIEPFMDGLERVEFEILRTQAMGKLVMNERVDRFIRNDPDPEINDWIFPITGVIVVEDGKIVYWKDYRIPGKATQM